MRNSKVTMLRAATAVARALGANGSMRLAKSLSGMLASLPDVDGRHRIVASHMARAMGREISRDERRDLVKACYVSYARYWAESLRLPSLPLEEIRAGIEFEGLEHLEKSLASGNGAIMAVPHLGGWEWGGTYLATNGYPVSVVVEPLHPPEVFEWFMSYRRELGMDVIPVGPEAGRRVLQALSENRTVCLMSDRIVGGANGLDVDFFGEKAKIPSGPVTLAIRSGAALLPSAIYMGGTAESHHVVIRPALELERKGRLREDVEIGTQLLATELEHLIRRAPTQWHLMQPNWPSDPRLGLPWQR